MLQHSQELWDDNFVGKQKNKALKAEALPVNKKPGKPPNKLATVDSVSVVDRL